MSREAIDLFVSEKNIQSTAFFNVKSISLDAMNTSNDTKNMRNATKIRVMEIRRK